MWIRRKRFAELCKKVESLESDCRNLQEQFRIYGAKREEAETVVIPGGLSYYYGGYMPTHSMPRHYYLRDVMKMLLDHFGLELKTVDSVPEKTVLEKKKK